MQKIKIVLETIVHATEDVNKIFKSLEILGIQKNGITIENVAGHFDNPILMLKAKMEKKEAQEIIKKISNSLAKNDLESLIKDLNNHIHNSTLYLRISKQDLITGHVYLKENDSIKIKVTVPVFNKKAKYETFARVLSKE